MKKTYIAPKAVAYNVNTKYEITVTSPQGGVETGDKLGDEYSDEDVSYTKGDNTVSIWDLY